jgi:hypothetical protein
MFVGKQIQQLFSRSDLMGLILSLLPSESRRNVNEFPWLNVVVRFLPAVNVSLDGVTVVANHKAILAVRSSGLGHTRKCHENQGHLHNRLKILS